MSPLNGSTHHRTHPSRVTRHPSANRPWAVESRGLDVVPDRERHGSATDLFWLWIAANLGLIGVVYGAMIATLGLDLAQAATVAGVGTAGSFLVVGVLGVDGQRRGAPMLALSRRCFGRRGNLGPTLASWLSLVSWETITAVVAADAVLALFRPATRGWPGQAAAIAAILTVTALALAVGRLGHATIVVVQRAVAWIFGLATLAVATELALRANWTQALAVRPAPASAVVAGVSIVAASAGISWVNVSADYTRYLPRDEGARSVTGWTTLGGSLPLFVLILVGYALSTSEPGLAGSLDPIGALRSALPGWASPPYLTVAYLTVAVVGLLAQMVMGLYSSGLALLALGLRVRRSRSVLFEALVIVCAGGWMMLGGRDLLGFLVSLVELLACPIAAWAAVFLADAAFRRAETTAAARGLATVSWAAGTIAGLLLTSSPIFTGPLARGILARSSLGYFVGSAVAAGLFAATRLVATHLARTPEGAAPPPTRATAQADPAAAVTLVPPAPPSRRPRPSTPAATRIAAPDTAATPTQPHASQARPGTKPPTAPAL